MEKVIVYLISIVMKLVAFIIIVETATIPIAEDTDLHTKIARYFMAIALFLTADILEVHSLKQTK